MFENGKPDIVLKTVKGFKIKRTFDSRKKFKTGNC